MNSGQAPSAHGIDNADPPSQVMVSADGICRTFGSGHTAVHALRGVSFTVGHGQLVALRGRSGCYPPLARQLARIAGLSRGVVAFVGLTRATRTCGTGSNCKRSPTISASGQTRPPTRNGSSTATSTGSTRSPASRHGCRPERAIQVRPCRRRLYAGSAWSASPIRMSSARRGNAPVPGGRHSSAERTHALSLGAPASTAVVVLSSRKPPDWCCHSRA
jgi:hypothetical protein